MLAEALRQWGEPPIEADHQRRYPVSLELRRNVPQFSLFKAERLLDEDCLASSQGLQR
jgi:hypothetical protein